MKPTILATALTGVAIMLSAYCLTPAARSADRACLGKKVLSPDFRDNKFNPGESPSSGSWAGIASTTWDFLFRKNDRTPDTELPRQLVDLSHFGNPNGSQLSVTWLGHSSLMINIDGYKILTDPVFEKRVSILGPTRFNGEVPLDIRQLPQIDVVLISHDHYDHLNRYSLELLIEKTRLFAVPLAVGARLVKWGVPPARIVELYWWQEYRFKPNLMIAATPAQHFSGRGLTDRNKTLWASWVIITPAHRLFFSGDSGYFDGFRQIGEAYGPFDMTFIECGAYNKSWERVHMFPEQTVQAHLDLNGIVLHPIHWATFNLALHPWYEPMERLADAAQRQSVQISTPMVGETTVYDKAVPAARWWRQAMAKQQPIVKAEN